MFKTAGKVFISVVIFGGLLVGGSIGAAAEERIYEISNSAYRLSVTCREADIAVRFYDSAMDFVWCDGVYLYRAERLLEAGTEEYCGLESASVEQRENKICITGVIAGLEMQHIYELPAEEPIMEERIVLRNPTGSVIALADFEAGFVLGVTSETLNVLPDFIDDELVPIPFRRRPVDGYLTDISLIAFLKCVTGEGPRRRGFPGLEDSRRNFSEGWAWTHGENTLGIFKFNQDNIQFSVITVLDTEEGLALRFGGASMLGDAPAALGRMRPGQSVDLGVVRYQSFKGDYNGAMYAYRKMLDEKGCRFPADYNPPVHWNELYDNPEWQGVSTPGKPAESRWEARKYSYSKALIEEEAQKAVEYSCESLYLDPGWDTRLGSFIWGEDWLGPCDEFFADIRSKYGLKVSLHCPLASWISTWHKYDDDLSKVYPRESFKMGEDGKVVDNVVCLGSKQYLDVAAERLLKCCRAGVCFLMFDGNWWTPGCRNPGHGHPVPHCKEDHIRANVSLAQRIHAEYPDVLIEMHDMLAGPARQRPTPVYYKYGLEGSYDDNWGFELMWDPYKDITSKRACALYYYNLMCNVPVYLHVDLRTDNEHCIVLWWYASTCRHLGIGGTHPNPYIAWRQKLAMKEYRRLERFYKRGEFYGIGEQIHLHVLPEENAMVVNVFNLSGKRQTIQGRISVEQLGLDPNLWYLCRGSGGVAFHKDIFLVAKKDMEPWSAEMTVFTAGRRKR